MTNVAVEDEATQQLERLHRRFWQTVSNRWPVAPPLTKLAVNNSKDHLPSDEVVAAVFQLNCCLHIFDDAFRNLAAFPVFEAPLARTRRRPKIGAKPLRREDGR